MTILKWKEKHAFRHQKLMLERLLEKWSGHHSGGGIVSILITVHFFRNNCNNIYLWVDLKPCTDGFKWQSHPTLFKQHQRIPKKIFDGRLPLYEILQLILWRNGNHWRNCGDYSMLVATLVPKGSFTHDAAFHHSFPTSGTHCLSDDYRCHQGLESRSILQSSSWKPIEGSVHETLGLPLFHQGTIQAVAEVVYPIKQQLFGG